MTAKTPATRKVRITRKSPVAWLNLQLLIDTGILAAISSFTGSRSPRREVLAALELAKPKDPDYFDYSTEPKDEVWIDFIADLGDGFDATHSIAWLVGRDHLGLGPVGKSHPQPNPPDQFTERGPKEFPGAEHVLPAGQITIFGGDLVYPYATRTEYEDRTVGPYLAARPWQLDPGVSPDKADKATGRRLFTIPGNHDWYDGLSAFVQRFCQPKRWMGCWQVQQRRSYFAILLPHRVWIWGVDLATDDNFDAPQLEYFTARSSDLKPGDDVILCVPKPAWVDRVVEEGEGADADKPTRSWESWKKVERIKSLILGEDGDRTGARLLAILSGDLHHYSRYETTAPSVSEVEKTHLITCGGGGAFLLGTDSLPGTVRIGTELTAGLHSSFPTASESQSMRNGALRHPEKHWKLFSVLGLTMVSLVWLLEAQGPETFATGPDLLGSAFFAALFAALVASPIPFALTGLTVLGFLAFANTSSDGKPKRAFLAGMIHFLAQFMVAVFLVHHIVPMIVGLGLSQFPTCLLIGVMVFGATWLVSGYVLLLYLISASSFLNLHRQEVFSVQAIADWKAFLRIRVHSKGVTIYPIGLRKICSDWRFYSTINPPGTGSRSGRFMRLAQRAVDSAFDPVDEVEVPEKATHLTLPMKPLAPHLIEAPIEIQRGGRRSDA